MAGLDFVHLHVHSSYSLLEGALTIARLAELAKADRQPALALTDTDNMFGALEFSEKLSGYGIQPIIGCALAVDFGDTDHGPRNRQCPTGTRAHCAACGAARGLPQPDAAEFARFPRNAGERTAAPQGSNGWTARPPASSRSRVDQAGRSIARLPPDKAIWRPVVLMRCSSCLATGSMSNCSATGHRPSGAAEPGLIDLAYAKSVPLVATNEPYFATAQDYEAHDALICIAEGRLLAESDRRQLTPEHRFKSRAEMVERFADLPEAVDSTVEIAQRCAFRPRTHQPILPRFSSAITAGRSTRRASCASAPRRGLSAASNPPALRLVTPSMNTASGSTSSSASSPGMKYPGYFLIVSDFIQWAKKQGIPVGPGRGSGAGSLVSYALTITDLDPIRFGLLFERFLNPERVSMPDFDIDFCQDRRDEVIRYVQERYGRDQVAQIITFGTLQARGVLRDVGRVLQMPYGQVDKLCKLVPQNPAAPVSLKQAIEGEPRLQAERDSDAVVKRAFDIAQKLEGLNRHASTHAAGIVIGDRPLSELVPLYRDPKSDMPVTQFNMKWVEQAGLVKFDFLGLKTLTVLQTAVALVKRRGIDIDLAAIPLDDKNTYDLLARAEAVGIFQLESAGMRRALLDMRPDRFEDIIALVALYRPGPMANIPTYCARKHGMEQPDYIHPEA